MPLAMAELAIVPSTRFSFRPELKPDPLRDRLAHEVATSVLEFLDPERLQGMAEDLGVVKKHRVHHLGLVACSLITSAYQRSTDTQGRWLDAQCLYEQLGGNPSSKTSFRTACRRCQPVLRRLLRRGLRALAKKAPEKLRGRLEQFADILIPDGCAFKLAKALTGLYPGTGTDAELKLHAVYSVRVGAEVSLSSSAGSMHDSDGFWPEPWQSGALYIWDLGYQNSHRFVQAQRAGAQVLQRLKDKVNPVVLASYGPTGRRRALVHDDGSPMRLNEAIEFGFVHKSAVLDLDIELVGEKGDKTTVRVVCVPFAGEDRYYQTTLCREVFTPQDVAELYRIRWEVELLFRSWKGALRLDEVRRLKNPQSLQTAVYAALCASVLNVEVHQRLQHLTDEDTPVALSPPPAAFFPRAARGRIEERWG
jgi:putative transposase